METRIKYRGKTGRIKVLAANPRTARGFSGDLILDEFGFHEDSRAIWEAAEPILSSNPDYLCRIASTLNGRRNMFHQLLSSGIYPVSMIRRSDAWKKGLHIYHPVTRKEITPDQARELALDKRAYDQNYECIASDEAMALLTHDLITQAQAPGIGVICDCDWSNDALQRIEATEGPLYLGVDVGRNHDLTVFAVVEILGGVHYVRAILRMDGVRLPDQQQRLAAVCNLPNFRTGCVDMTGLGLGLVEYAQEEFGTYRIQGINFGSSVPATNAILSNGRKGASVRVTEAMATELLSVYESRLIKHPNDSRLYDDLRKPERITTPGGRVSIAASRDSSGHADHFWALALAIEAARSGVTPTTRPTAFKRGEDRRMLAMERSVLA